MTDALHGNRTVSEFVRLRLKRTHMLVAPIRAPDNKVIGEVIVVHDATYIRTEIFRAWSRFFLRIAAQVLVIAIITLLVLRWSLTWPDCAHVAVDEGTSYRTTRRSTHGTRSESSFAFRE